MGFEKKEDFNKGNKTRNYFLLGSIVVLGIMLVYRELDFVSENNKEISEYGYNKDVVETEADEVIEIVEEVEPEPVTEDVYTVVEKMPSFPGGEAKLYEYLGENIKYPLMAKESGVQGKVYIQFVVEKDGSITEVNVARGIGGGCDKEALRVTAEMPKWSPGEQRGKKVRVKYTLPIVYQLR